MGKKNSRIKNSLFNFVTSMGAQLVSIIMHFVSRSVFINTLGENYLGISGLFGNILSMLSLAELGVGTAILYRLYSPLAQNDKPKIQAWMHFYKQAYRIIGLVVACVGLCFIPFLPVMINDYEKLDMLGINAVFIYCLFLFKNVSSYLFFAYRSAIVKADQKEYLLTIVGYIITFSTTVLQIISLVLLKNFIVYLIIEIVMVFVQNIIFAVVAHKKYPYINEKPKEKVSREEVKNTIKDCLALMLYKINAIVLKSTDYIVLSVFMGLKFIGIYSNYYIFYTTIHTLFNKIFGSIVHSIGNLHATKKVEHEYLIFKTTLLTAIILGSTAGVGIYVVADELVATWIGTNWVIEQPFSLVMGLELFTLALCTALGKFRHAFGLFQQAKYRPIFSAIVNIVVSVIGVKYLGVVGVILGTIISYWTTFLVYDPVILFKHGFDGKYPVRQFYFSVLGNLLIVSAAGFGLKVLCSNFLVGLGWISVIAHVIICGVTVPLVLVLVNWKKSETQYLYGVFKKKFLKRK